MFKKIFSLFTEKQKKKKFFITNHYSFYKVSNCVVSVIPLIYAISTPNKSDLFAKVSF